MTLHWLAPHAENALRDGAALDEAEAILGVLGAMRKSPGGASTVLLLALAAILDKGDYSSAKREAAMDATPRILRDMLASFHDGRAAVPVDAEEPVH